MSVANATTPTYAVSIIICNTIACKWRMLSNFRYIHLLIARVESVIMFTIYFYMRCYTRTRCLIFLCRFYWLWLFQLSLHLRQCISLHIIHGWNTMTVSLSWSPIIVKLNVVIMLWIIACANIIVVLVINIIIARCWICVVSLRMVVCFISISNRSAVSRHGSTRCRWEWYSIRLRIYKVAIIILCSQFLTLLHRWWGLRLL